MPRSVQRTCRGPSARIRLLTECAYTESGNGAAECAFYKTGARSAARPAARRAVRDSAGHAACSIEKSERRTVMLSWALTFLVIALIAALFGFTGIAGAASQIAQILFFVFLVL